jgi:hypothetical protein
MLTCDEAQGQANTQSLLVKEAADDGLLNDGEGTDPETKEEAAPCLEGQTVSFSASLGVMRPPGCDPPWSPNFRSIGREGEWLGRQESTR